MARHLRRAPARPTHTTLLTATLLGVIMLGCGSVAPQATKAATVGALDPAFDGGLVELPPGTQLNGAVVQRDGKLVVTGVAGGEAAQKLLVARLTPAGALDATFGLAGFVLRPLPPGTTGVRGEAVEIQRDGRIVVAGSVRARSGTDGMLVTRLNAGNGSPDTSFGSGGTATVLRGGLRQAAANALAIRSDGRIVLGGKASRTGALAQLSSRGRLISARALDIGPATIEAIALRAGGKIAFAGTRTLSQSTVPIVGQANADGTKDTSFGRDGVSQRNYARQAASSGFGDIAVQPGGGLVATGYAFDGRGGQMPGALGVTARFDAAGNPDASFGPGGACLTRAARTSQVSTQPPPGFTSIAIDGAHVYTAGGWDESGSSALNVQARTANGTADRSFGAAGQTVSPVRNYAAPAFGKDVALGPQGLYVVGTTGTDSDGDGDDDTTGVIARYGAHPFAFRHAPRTAPSSSPSARRAAPRLSAVALSRGRVSAGRPTSLRFRLSRAGRVRITVEQRLVTRPKNSTCSAPGRGSAAYYKVLSGQRVVGGRRGRNARRLSRTVTTRALSPGRYRVVVQAVRGSQTVGSRRTVALTVAR